MSTTTFKSDLFRQFARIGGALSSGARLEMLELLAQQERSVDALARALGLSMANASQHLKQLRQAGLVIARKEGLHVFYRIAGDDVLRLFGALLAAGEKQLADIEQMVRAVLAAKDNVEPVSPAELLHRVREGSVTVLDVRPAEEFAASHLPGAINIPLDELAGRLRELPARREVVAYCRGPYCLLAFEAVEALRNKGRKARRLSCGLPEWKLAGHAVERA
jgi:DNA-binding transcriptional ArsR family regulator/rhodanese-related sulfurtransferase